ncbi:hypothetical protein [Brevundimonas sp.]|jgi:hypothetical protein|uniref:hypothetical protein n=1 Tax=Brevundimonas sp. TaxID=1871086 RepID=UPI003782E618
MEFQEYPKAVYKLDDQRIVQGAAEEEQASSEGYGPWVCKTLREVAAPQGNEEQSSPLQPLDAPDGAAFNADDIDQVRAKLKELGISYHHASGLAKLQSLLPQ